MNTQIQHNSKSLLTSTNLGYDKEELIISNIISDDNKGFAEQEIIERIPIIIQDNPIKLPDNSILDSANTGFGQYHKIEIEYIKPEIIQPEIPEQIPSKVVIQTAKPPFKEDSILDNVDSGYGFENKIVVECEKPKFKTHLCKENYLGEFKTEFEKQQVRKNLGIEQEVIKIIHSSHLVTVDKLDQKLANLDFTSSILKSYAKYDIPNNLFI